jgi:hypothetical protein
VPSFIERAFYAGNFGGDGGTIGLLEAHLDARIAHGGFLQASIPERTRLLEELDQQAFARSSATPSHEPVDQPEMTRLWRVVKLAIVTGYYTSELGGSEELAYNLVPGRYEPDIQRGTEPYLSNGWTENLF